MLYIGKGILKKLFILDNNIEGPCVAVEIRCQNIFKNNISVILENLGFVYKGSYEIPVLRKKGEMREAFTKGKAYIRQKDGSFSSVFILDNSIDGESNNEYFTMLIRK